MYLFRDHVVRSYSRPIDSTTIYMAYVTVKPLQTVRAEGWGAYASELITTVNIIRRTGFLPP